MNYWKRMAGQAALGAACLGLVLAGSPASAATCTPGAGSTCFNLTVSITTATQNDYLVFHANPGAVDGYKSLGNLPSTFGIPFPQSVSVPAYITSGYGTALGLYTNAGGSTGVVIGLNSSASTAAQGQAWNSLFTDATYSEANVTTDLQNNDTAALEAFLNAYSSDFFNYTNGGPPSAGDILGFSNGTTVGSFSISESSLPGAPVTSATPEPSTYLLLGVGLGLLALVRIRRQLRHTS